MLDGQNCELPQLRLPAGSDSLLGVDEGGRCSKEVVEKSSSKRERAGSAQLLGNKLLAPLRWRGLARSRAEQARCSVPQSSNTYTHSGYAGILRYIVVYRSHRVVSIQLARAGFPSAPSFLPPTINASTKQQGTFCRAKMGPGTDHGTRAENSCTATLILTPSNISIPCRKRTVLQLAHGSPLPQTPLDACISSSCLKSSALVGQRLEGLLLLSGQRL
jgi:hypothetical protein